MRNSLPLFILLFLSTSGVSAQTLFEKQYGGKGDQYGYGVAVTADGFVACGHTAPEGSLVTDAWVLRFDAEGDTIWTRKYGGTEPDDARSVMVTIDGKLAVCGTWTEPSPQGPCMYLMKTDLDGNPIWTQRIVTPYNSYGYTVAPAGSSFILCGYADYIGNTPRMMLALLDPNGDTVWTRLYGDTLATAGFSAIKTDNGGYIACGYIDNYEPEWNRNTYVVRTDYNGDTLWTRSYPNTGYDVAWSIAEAGTGFILTGYRNYMGSIGTNLSVMRIDEDGSLLWEKNYGQSGLDIGYSGIQTSDGGFVFTGQSNEQGNEFQALYLLKTDANGDTLWTRLLGNYPLNSGACVRETSDGGLIITGGTNSGTTDGLYDLLLVRTDEDGTITYTNTMPPSGALMPVYPNPSNGTFGFTSGQPVVRVEVLDTKGISVFDEHPETPVSGTHEIILPGNLKGLFLVRITTLQNTVTRKLVVR